MCPDSTSTNAKAGSSFRGQRCQCAAAFHETQAVSVNGPQLRDGLQDRIRSIKDYGKYKSDLKTEGFFNIF